MLELPYYSYRGRDKKGKQKTGRLKAENQSLAIEKLKESQIFVVSIQEKTGILYKDINLQSVKKVKLEDLVVFLRQFSTLITAGIPLVHATRILSDQTSSKLLRKILVDIANNLEKGHTLSEATSKHAKAFPLLFINMLRAGEATGKLGEILEHQAIYFEKQYQTREKVKSALAYPIMILFFATGIVAFLLAFVVPIFADMLDDLGGELPTITKIVLWVGDLFSTYWWLFLLSLFVLVVSFVLLKRQEKASYYIDYFLLRLPFVGLLLQKAALARLTRTLGSLLYSAVPILEAFTIVEEVVGNRVYSHNLQKARAQLEKGESIKKPLEESRFFPPLVTQMVAVGEQTGNLDDMFSKIADFYEADIDRMTDRLKSLIEPIMISLLAVIVGGIVAAVAIPMFSMFERI